MFYTKDYIVLIEINIQAMSTTNNHKRTLDTKSVIVRITTIMYRTVLLHDWRFNML